MKEKIREEIHSLRENHPVEHAIQKSSIIKEKLFSLPEFKKTGTILFYVSIKNEVKTQEMIVEAIDMGKRVCVPVSDFENKSMEASHIGSMLYLEKTKFGLLEPKVSRPIPPEQIDLVIIPGVAFDREGNRVGYGSGFYDRFLPKLRKGAKKIALAYDLQIVEKIPTGENDVSVEKIITEDEIIQCSR